MNIAEIENKIEELVQQPYRPETFAFDFISIFDNIPKTTITKLRQGIGNPGHTSPATTSRYIEMDAEAQKRLVNVI
jgi:hypothetical protein